MHSSLPRIPSTTCGARKEAPKTPASTNTRRCSVCKSPGHNKATCALKGDEMAIKLEEKRAKMDQAIKEGYEKCTDDELSGAQCNKILQLFWVSANGEFKFPIGTDIFYCFLERI